MRKAAERDLKDKKHEIKVLRGELDLAKRKIRILMGMKGKAEVVELFASLADEGRSEEDEYSEL